MLLVQRLDRSNVYTQDGRASGVVAEWLKATVLKTAVSQGTGGSNPPCSAGGIRYGASVCCFLERCESGRIGLPAKELHSSECRGFESPLLRFGGRLASHSLETIAQLDRVSDCGSEGRRFESA